ncbi:MAG: response regulator transcription factor [Lachnospiraceae bacterium]
MSHKTLVLLIEDEKNIRNFISTTLLSNHYKIITAVNGKDGLSLISSQCPDIILLDLGLPDMDGLEVIRNVRTWASIPIIVLSARIQEQEKVMALDVGADDYITKPFGTSELLARMRTALRHNYKSSGSALFSQHPYEAKGLHIDFEKHQITICKEEIHLTQIEFKILMLLAHNSGKVMTYDTIMTNIWGPFSDTNNRILRVNMANIRRKIEKNPAEPQYIFTEIGIGYRMIEDEYCHTSIE